MGAVYSSRVIAAVALSSTVFTALIAALAVPGLAAIAPVLSALIAVRFLLGCGTAPKKSLP